MIEVKKLTKKFGSHTAVDGISFTVNDGEILGFLGPNGAGKTTTMNMMTGFISSTEGEVKIKPLSSSIHSGCFSCTVWSKKAKYFSVINSKTYTVYSSVTAKFFGQFFYFNHSISLLFRIFSI